jgi:hypothetical protein
VSSSFVKCNATVLLAAKGSENKQKVFTDAKEVAKGIDAFMEYAAPASDKRFSSNVVEVRVESPSVPDLTLLDLPGPSDSTCV